MEQRLITRVGLALAILAVAIFLAVADVSPVGPPSSQAPLTSNTKEDLLWWLPPDTESVVAAKGPFPFPIESKNEPEEDEQDWFQRKATAAEIRLAFQTLPFELASGLEWDTSARGLIVAYAMQGSRHFREPLPGLEVMDFEGCSIVVFENKSSELVGSLVLTLAKKASRADIVAGTRVLVFVEKSGDAERSLFLAAPQPNVLLVANNLAYLREVLERLGQRKAPRAFPDELPEWRFLNREARFWGMRHYDRTRAKEDPTSPFSEDRTFGPGDQKAIGVLFYLDPDNPRKAVVTSLSGDETKAKDAAAPGRTVAEPQEGVKFEVELRNPAPGVLQQIYPLDQSSTLDYFILTVTIALGRGMYF